MCAWRTVAYRWVGRSVEVRGDGCGLAGGQVVPTRSTRLYTLVSAATTRGSGVVRDLAGGAAGGFFGGGVTSGRGCGLVGGFCRSPIGPGISWQVAVSEFQQFYYF